MRHFLMPILTPNFKDWSKLQGTLIVPGHAVLKYDLTVTYDEQFTDDFRNVLFTDAHINI